MFWLNLHLASGCTDGEDCTKSYAPAENVVVESDPLLVKLEDLGNASSAD